MKKPPIKEVLSNTRLTGAVVASIVTVSKQSAVAMTNQLYTRSIKSRKPIDFINALVSPKHCENDADFSLTFKKDDQKLLQKIGQHRILSGSRNEVGRCPRNGQGNPSNLYISADERAVAMGEIK